MQPAVKKMFGARNHNHRQFLRSGPVQDSLERNDVVLITVNDEDVRDGFDVLPGSGIGRWEGRLTVQPLAPP